MTPRAIATVALKIWGAILVVGALVSIPVTALALATASVSLDADQAVLIRQSQVYGILNILVRGIAGILLLTRAHSAVDRFIPEGQPLQISATPAHLQAFGFALAGVFVLVEGVQDFAVAAYTFLTQPSSDETPQFEYLWARQSESVVRSVVGIICGSILIFGRDAIASGWSRIRSVRPSDWR